MHVEDTYSVPPSEKYINSPEAQRIADYYNVSQQDAEEHLSMIERQKQMVLDFLKRKAAALS